MSEKYEQILQPYYLNEEKKQKEPREQKKLNDRNPLEVFYTDRTRIIYSASFRRLQQKAQVFSLEPNSSVRTRLTHSLEVSDIGRRLAQKIAQGLLKKGVIEEALVPQIVTVVENACLLHDIGNPPFGHFGESAIRKWMSVNLGECMDSAGVGHEALKKYITDFTEFDGNPQGFRTVTRLYCEKGCCGLDLSYPTLLTGIKYTCFPDEIDRTNVLAKKAGYFYSEKDLIDEIYKTSKIGKDRRYPLTYIMGAADDIAYSLSDISDGIEKRIITENSFSNEFIRTWKKKYATPCPQLWTEAPKSGFGDKIAYWSSHMIEEAAQNFLDKHDAFFKGNLKEELISENSDSGKFLKTIKSVSRSNLYRSPDAENIELSGYSIITGLLDSFGALLKMPYNQFDFLTNKKKSPEGKGIDYEWRIYNRLSQSCKENYEKQLNSRNKMGLGIALHDYEWWLRVHMILDHIAGMTDEYALAVYQMLKGISIGTGVVK